MLLLHSTGECVCVSFNCVSQLMVFRFGLKFASQTKSCGENRMIQTDSDRIPQVLWDFP